MLDRSGFAKDRNHVYQLDRPISDDPAHFELIDGGLSKDSTAVYWTDGSVLSDDPAHFAIVSNNDHYLFTKDSRTIHVNGNPITDADPATFHVLQGAYAQDARARFLLQRPDRRCGCGDVPSARRPLCERLRRVYWMGKPIDGADPATFRVLNADFECSADQPSTAYYRQSVIAEADPRTFPAGRAVTNCSEASISFAD